MCVSDVKTPRRKRYVFVVVNFTEEAMDGCDGGEEGGLLCR